MTKANIEVILEGHEAGAITTVKEWVKWVQTADAEMMKLGRNARQSTKGAKDGAKGAGDEMSRMGNAAFMAAKQFIGFGSAVGILFELKQTITAIVDEFVKIRELKAETFGAAVQAGQIFQKTAALPVYAQKYGDQALKTVTAQGIDVALRSGSTMEIAGQSMFYTTSALSHLPEKERLAAAEEMASFGSVHEMTSDEMAGLPQLWKVEGAETGKKMRDVMNTLYVGVGESIAEFGEALKFFPRMRAVQKQYGFTLEESMGMYTGALDIMNAARAGQTSMIATELALGRTEKGMKYLRRIAKDQGIADYGALSPSERTRALGTHIEQMIEQKDWKGVTDFLMAMGGGRGSGRMAIMQYSDTSTAKMRSTRARLEETRGQDLLGDVYAAYDQTPLARKQRTESRMFKSDVERGYDNASLAVHNMIVDKVVERLHEQAADPVKLAMITGLFGDMGAEAFRKNVGGKMIRASLTGIRPGHPKYGRAQEILGMGPQLWTTNTELMDDIMQMTGDMQSWSQGTIMTPGGYDKPIGMGPHSRVPIRVPATDAGAFSEAMTSVLGTEQLDVQKETLSVLKSIDAKLGGGGDAAVGPMGPPWSSRGGNTDQ